MKSNHWFKSKRYLHIGERLSIDSRDDVIAYVSNNANVESHNFLPLIHETISIRKFKKLLNEEDDFYRSHFNKIESKPTAKKREIFYPNHLDAHIYSFYANEVLGEPYRKKLDANSFLNQSVIGYRRIPVSEGAKKNKCNIHFAKEVFDEIKRRKDCVAVCYDIENFFPSLNHEYLKICWQDLLELNWLPKDHFKIFNSVTKYSYVEIDDIVNSQPYDEIFKLSHKNEFRNTDFNSYFFNYKEFRERIAKKNLIRVTCPNKEKGETSIKGIPQGTPISAFLANLYLMNFDNYIINELVTKKNCFYRRYSDDILLIFDNEDDFIAADTGIRRVIAEAPFYLKIKEEKTAVSIFKATEDGKLLCKTKPENVKEYLDGFPIRYLGFEFDGDEMLLKSASLSKYYRLMKGDIRRKYRKSYKAIKFNNKQVKKKKPKKLKPDNIYLTKLYRKYTHLGKNKKKSNFLTYVDRAAQVMYPENKGLDNPIKKQVRRSFSIFSKTVQRYKDKSSSK